jgi:hypothetical protein
MTEEDATDTYEQRARAIQLASQPILDVFERWLMQAGWSEQTIIDHVDNIRFFTKYLAWYTRSQHRLDEATDSDVYWFLADWFPKPRVVGFCCQREGVSGLVQEILQMDGRNQLGFSPNRC